MHLHPGSHSLVIAALTLLAAAQASAQCPEPIQGNACRVWPAKPEVTIRATTRFVADKSDPTGDTGALDLTLQLENSTSEAPIAIYQQPALYPSDAVGFRGLSIDTGRYTLNPDTRAFGLRAEYGHDSSANPYSAERLTLYVQEGRTLRPVLDGLFISSEQGEWGPQECTGSGSRLRRTVAMAATSTHGFADLIVHSETVSFKTLSRGSECVEDTGAPRVLVTTLRYNGSTYAIPDGLRPY